MLIASAAHAEILCGKHCTAIAQAQTTFQTEARHLYRLLAREQVNGTNRLRVWLVDDAENGVVGGVNAIRFLTKGARAGR